MAGFFQSRILNLSQGNAHCQEDNEGAALRIEPSGIRTVHEAQLARSQNREKEIARMAKDNSGNGDYLTGCKGYREQRKGKRLRTGGLL
ncbi:hypothetical protein BFC17_22035 [Alteromonas lipolytica]|uniref:Uncharacterized protein n=1 Tax=Alteromonas lipolytica TaxID=1856405 RepID=A0A1E8FF39_9ALTE|nr:hypothetical protein BFC17_22035 [Alteromonas lipolytica]